MYSFGLGGLLSSEANRIDEFDTYYTIKELGTYNPREDICHQPPGRDVMGPDSHSSPFLVNSNLGIKQWLTQAWPVGAFLRATRKSEAGVGAALKPEGYSPDTLSYHIKFILTSNINATPTWNLVRVSTSSNPLFEVGRMRTHDLLVTIGPGAPPTTPIPGRGLLSRRLSRPSDQAAALHNAQLIGSAVANALRTAR